MGAGAARLQLATYPQSPFSGPAHCCDVTDLYQAFSQRTGPGRLWISLDAPVCCPLSIDRATKKPSRKNQPKDAELQFRPVQSEGSRQCDTSRTKMSFSSARRTEPEIDRCGNAGSPERDMSPGEYGVTAYAEVHLAVDCS